MLEEEEEEEEEGEKHQKWKISKIVGGRMTYIHVKQALKLLLPREYIARCRQKCHWAAKYLPGKLPLDPTHDVVRYSHVTLKSVLKGRKVFDIARVEAIQSSKDGSSVASCKLRGDTTMKLRFSLYQQSSNDDTYSVHPVLGLTKWKASSAILGVVELIPVGEDTLGCYKLHDTSSKHLKEMGHVCRVEVELGTDSATSETVVEYPIDGNQLPDDFYEIENVLEQRLCHKTLAYTGFVSKVIRRKMTCGFQLRTLTGQSISNPSQSLEGKESTRFTPLLHKYFQAGKEKCYK